MTHLPRAAAVEHWKERGEARAAVENWTARGEVRAVMEHWMARGVARAVMEHWMACSSPGCTQTLLSSCGQRVDSFL